MQISDFDCSAIYVRMDGSFIINNGTYHVPNEGEWAELWAEVAAYAAEHPGIVSPEPEEAGNEAPLTMEERLDDIENALVELASIIAGGE